MSQTLLELAYQLTQAGKSFVLATVVWCERPTSAKPGAQAIIQDDGEGGHLTGWVGGSCTQPVVLREALRSLRSGDDPYLLRVGASDKGIAREDVRVFPMTCTSGGVIDIYMEPHLPKPQLVLVGNSPVTYALARLAPILDFSVIHTDTADLGQIDINTQTYILVATHGQYDEDVLERALHSSARYVGMVASHRRADGIREYLRASQLSEQQIARLKAPAGLDTGAVTPEEIASSILAELVQVRRRGQITYTTTTPVSDTTMAPPSGADVSAGTAIDPVCDMMVEIATARHHSTYDGREFYFCCPACKRSFERNPQEYLVAK